MTVDFSLPRCPLFTDLTPMEVDSVLALVERNEFPSGELLITEGKRTRMLWILLNGRCQVLKHSASGGEHELAVVEAGGVFGEMSFFQDLPHSASVRSLTSIEVLQLSYEKFEQIELSGSRAAYKVVRNLLRIVSERLRRMDEWTCQLVNHQADDTRREEWLDFRSKLYTGWNF
mgnify:CR=1 FL=1